MPNGDYAGFITRYTGELPQEGDYLDDNGTVIGRHKGVLYYTIGQRRGLGIALGVKHGRSGAEAAKAAPAIDGRARRTGPFAPAGSAKAKTDHCDV